VFQEANKICVVVMDIRELHPTKLCTKNIQLQQVILCLTHHFVPLNKSDLMTIWLYQYLEIVFMSNACQAQA